MKHLTKYEDFAYHSPIEEEIPEGKKPPTHEKIEREKCFKCMKNKKPIYQPVVSREIQRLL